MSNKLFDENFQLYMSWSMNLVEFTSWVTQKTDTLGLEEFNKKYPTFSSAYIEYANIISGEDIK